MKLPSNLKKIGDIGKGGFGEVILCSNDFLLRKEAIKIIPIDITNKTKAKDIFLEPLLLDYLRKSDYIVKIYDANIIGKDKFIIRMEYLKNGSLEDRGMLSIKEFLKISEHISYALEYIHHMNILHLDIKPGNILIGDNGGYKLSDFGLSNIKDKKGQSEFKSIYNLHTPPENIDFKGKPTVQTDIYMLGMTLYRLINGELHYLRQLKKGNVNKLITNGNFPDRKNYLPNVPKKIKTLINKAINVDVNKRFKDIKEFRKALNNLNLKYFWSPIEKKGDYFLLKCYSADNDLVYHIEYKKLPNGSYTLDFKKHNLKSVQKVKQYCYKKLTYKELIKNINKICSEVI